LKGKIDEKCSEDGNTKLRKDLESIYNSKFGSKISNIKRVAVIHSSIEKLHKRIREIREGDWV